MASVSILGVSFLAATSVASLSVDAVLLTQMISCCTFIQVPAADPVGIQNETRGTRTNEASFGVLAIVLAWFRYRFALVYVYDLLFNI